MQTRQIIRNQLLAIRRDLTPSFCKEAAIHATNRLIKTDLFKHSINIAVYLAINNELNTELLIQHIWQQNKNCYVPIINSSQCTITFVKYTPSSKLIKNKYNILEPILEVKDVIQASDLDLVVTPLVGFDLHGNRLGMGGGYYDRTFAFKQQSHSQHKPLLVGIGYEFQKIQEIASENWDITLDYVVTDAAIYAVRAATRAAPTSSSTS